MEKRPASDIARGREVRASVYEVAAKLKKDLMVMIFWRRFWEGECAQRRCHWDDDLDKFLVKIVFGEKF